MKVKICNCIDNNPIREFDIDQSNLTNRVIYGQCLN